MKRYESAIRVITAFFGVLLGFGLKRLLDNDSFDPHPAEIPCFVLAVLLFVRFLLGSSNHMWFEFVRPDLSTKAGSAYPVPKLRILYDFSFLLIFGAIGMAICYSKKLDQFLDLNILLLAVALLWVVVYFIAAKVREAFQKRSAPVPQARWSNWWWVNFAQLVAVLLAKLTCVRNSLDSLSWWRVPDIWPFSIDMTYWATWFPSLTLSLLILIYFAIFLVDVHFQLTVLQES
jgi:hypothetical protein